MKTYISIEGELFDRQFTCLTAANRSFRYGDGLFETIKVCRGKVLWVEYHFQRLLRSASVIKLILPGGFSVKEFEGLILSLYSQNHPENEPARIRFSLFRKDGGLYTPDNNNSSYLIESEKLITEHYAFHEKGLDIELYPEQKKAINQLSVIKTSSALLYVMAALYKKENGFDDCLLLNQHGNIAEAISSNVFVVCGNRIITPGLDQGCVDGVMRSVLFDLLSEHTFCIEEAALHPSILSEADEVFLTNAISGITWVRSFRGRMFSNQISSKFHALLNDAVVECLD
jgi:branched-subunit amino acid aminotransferase/4-amino-4-deoxychorismate lyase